MMYKTVGTVLVAVHGKEPPTDEEWDGYIRCHQESFPRCTKTIVVTEGGGPNPKQRERMNEYLRSIKMELKVAVCAQSAVVRGIVTAISWFNPKIKAFSPDAIYEALDYLEVSPQSASRISYDIKQMRRALS